MNTHEPIVLHQLDPLLNRVSALESRLAAVEKENIQLRRTRGSDPRHVSRMDARQQLGCIGATKLHQLIREEHLEVVKLGRRTLITQASIDRYLAECAIKK